jgi:hypothetical protein
MATRMQQRRGTAQQWTTANPILAAGEIGFESGTNKFKIGDGVNTWSSLTYYASASEIAALVDGAPDLLNTLNELAQALGDDANFGTTIEASINTSVDEANTFTTTAVSDHRQMTQAVHGIADTSLLATTANVAAAKAEALTAAATAANAYTDTEVSELAAAAAAQAGSLATAAKTEAIAEAATDATTKADAAKSAAEATASADATSKANAAETAANTYTDSSITTHNDVTTGVHGIADTALLATKAYADQAEADAITAAEDYADGLASNYDAAGTATSAVSSHNALTTNVHGIADTSLLATQSYADTAEADAITAAGTAADSKISTAVAALTKSSVGLANVDNTADADKPVSTATQTALDLKANLNAPTFTGTVTSTGALVVEGNLTVSGTTTTVNAADLSITDPLIYLASNQYTEDVLDVGFMAATGAPGGTEASHLHSGFFRDASDSKKWKLVSNVPHPVNNVVDITNATRETLVVGALEATTVTPSSGVVFSDGTQTKEGVVSRTPIIAKTDSYTLSALTERDSLIEVAKSTATTITIPTDATLNFPIGTSIDILQTSTGQVTIAGAGGVTVNATPGLKLRTTWSSCTLFKRAANTWVVYGDLTA